MVTYVYILLIMSSIDLFAALFIIFRYQRTQSIYSLSGLLIGFALMSLFVAMILTDISYNSKMWFAKAAFMSGSISFVSFFGFAVSYLVPMPVPKNITRLLIGLFVFLIPTIFLFPNFIEELVVKDSYVRVVPGISFWIFLLINLIFFATTLIVLFKKIKYIQYSNIKYIILLLTVGGLYGIVTDRVFPLLNIQFNQVHGPITAGVVAILITVVALKK